jgi:hypothetical protein
VISSEELRILADERQATLRREAAVARMVRQQRAPRPVRTVQAVSPRLAIAAATVFVLAAGSLRVEH